MDYDTKGRLDSITTPEGNVLAYNYDGSLLLSSQWYGEITGNVAVGYNNNLQITSQSVNGAGTVNYTYDNDGLLTGAGNLVINRGTQNGLLSGTSLGSISTSYSYNNYGEITGYNAQFGGSNIFNTSYTLDSLGRITSLTETTDGSTNTYDYKYNIIGFLTLVKKNGVVISEYLYDSNGNRTAHITQSDTLTAVYDTQDRLVQYGNIFYSYSANGSLTAKVAGTDTTRYFYDSFGNLTKVIMPGGTLIDYIIDGQNRRIGKRVNGETVKRWLYQDQLNPVAEIDSAGNIIARYVYGSKINVPDYVITNDTTYAIITDHLGSVRMVINNSTGEVVQRIDYNEYGRVLNDTNPGFQPFGFAGGLYDEHTGFIRFGARDYDPSIGRWTAKDPILFDGGVSNLFEYAGNDPINSLDPEGLQDLKYKGIWRVHKFDADNIYGPHFHNIESGIKYFPERRQFLNPNTKEWINAGRRFAEGFKKTLKQKPSIFRKYGGRLPAIGLFLDILDAIRLQKEAEKNGVDIWTQWLIEQGFMKLYPIIGCPVEG